MTVVWVMYSNCVLPGSHVFSKGLCVGCHFMSVHASRFFHVTWLLLANELPLIPFMWFTYEQIVAIQLTNSRKLQLE